MIEHTGEVPVSMPPVRMQDADVTAQQPRLMASCVEDMLNHLGLPYELEDLSTFPEYRRVAIDAVLKNLASVEHRSRQYVGVGNEQLEHARYASRAILSIEARHASNTEARQFLVEAIGLAQMFDSQLRPVFAYMTEIAVEKVLLEDEEKAADLLGAMLNDYGESDGWSPIIDWEALKRFGSESVTMPVSWTADGTSMQLPLMPEQAIPEYQGKPVTGQFDSPLPIPDKGIKFVGWHNQDIATMQLWASIFADYPVSRLLRTDLAVIDDALALAGDDPGSYWDAYKNKPF